MNWDAVGAISEGLGSVAVMVTPLYLAIQVRHAPAETKRAVSLERLDMLRQELMADGYKPVHSGSHTARARNGYRTGSVRGRGVSSRGF